MEHDGKTADKRPENGQSKLAVFDFDGTLVRVDTLPYLLRLWGSLGYPRRRQLAAFARIGTVFVRYKLSRMPREQMKKTALQRFHRIFSGMSREAVGSFFDAAAVRMAAIADPQVMAEAAARKRSGYRTVLLSGFYEDMLARLAQQIGFDAVLGTQIAYRGGAVDTKTPLTIRTGAEKRARIRESFADADLGASCAYADGISDLDLLEMVGEAVAVAPDDALKQIALARGWRVMGG